MRRLKPPRRRRLARRARDCGLLRDDPAVGDSFPTHYRSRLAQASPETGTDWSRLSARPAPSRSSRSSWPNSACRWISRRGCPRSPIVCAWRRAEWSISPSLRRMRTIGTSPRPTVCWRKLARASSMQRANGYCTTRNLCGGALCSPHPKRWRLACLTPFGPRRTRGRNDRPTAATRATCVLASASAKPGPNQRAPILEGTPP